MNLSYKEMLAADFADDSKVWVYQVSRLLTMSEALEVEDMLKTFTDKWKSHGDKIKAESHLFFGQFIVLIADESQAHVGGCSTDSSTRFIRTIEEQFKVECFNRHSLAFVIKSKVETVPMQQLDYALQNGFINGDTLYFNNLVRTKKELEENWIISVDKSWLASKLPVTTK
ncbi:MAG: hypothetical protein E6Q95_00560 [Chitinophagaceae bacterium]|nr:MAG: hypothetical protein E6Q95_00560 [Chitinophagaceae bacterium]